MGEEMVTGMEMRGREKIPVTELLAHAPPMVLLDELLDWDETRLSAGLTIRPDNRFFEAGRGVPAHVGIEWMAQACGLFAGLEARTSGQPVRLGFLLGTRRFLATEPWFTEGESLVVSVRLIFRESGMAVFDCAIGERASARLTLYQPGDDAAILANQAMG